MRDIIFRGKAEGRNDWVEGLLIKVGKYCCILEPDCESYGETYLDAKLGTIDGQAVPVIPETVGQYTGMDDKNGKKIFEGDIIHCVTFGWERDEFITDIKFGPVFGQLGFYLGNKRSMFYFGQSDLTRFDDGEVIGNIHDNPELLEEKK